VTIEVGLGVGCGSLYFGLQALGATDHLVVYFFPSSGCSSSCSCVSKDIDSFEVKFPGRTPFAVMFCTLLKKVFVNSEG